MNALMNVQTFEIVYAVVLGLIVGSFLNVVAHRLPARMMWGWTNEALEFLRGTVAAPLAEQLAVEQKNHQLAPPGIVVERSACPHCGQRIAWWHNIPLLGYALLRGRCAHCQKTISPQYPLVELTMGVMAGACVAQWGISVYALAAGAFLAVLLVCAVIDWKTQLLPDTIVLPTMWASMLFALTPWAQISLQESVVGAAVGYLILWSVFWLFKLATKKDGMGYGDFKLLAAIGAFLGPSALLPVLLVATVAGSVVGLVLKHTRGGSQPFAFGPFLAFGSVVVLLWGTPIKHFFGL